MKDIVRQAKAHSGLYVVPMEEEVEEEEEEEEVEEEEEEEEYEK